MTPDHVFALCILTGLIAFALGFAAGCWGRIDNDDHEDAVERARLRGFAQGNQEARNQLVKFLREMD